MDTEKITGSMSLEDKIALCSGASFWETKKMEKYGIPSLFMCDGSHGLRKQDRTGGADMLGVNESRKATCFPAEVTTAASWDPDLTEKIGAAIGEEALDQGSGLVLGPGANLKRNPLCGRNFEYFSEDPYLAGKMAAGFIRGIESRGVGSSLKHFAANSQEKCRFNSDSIMDERTLRELYLTAFEIAVKEGKPSTVMCAYPKLNGIHCSDSRELLTDILRKEWGFDGLVVTDWGAMNDRIEGFRAGCDLNMPGGSSYMEKEVLKAVRSGALSEDCIDASVRRLLKLVFRAEENKKKTYECDYSAHHALAKKAAEEGAVLLKNEDGILPLEPGTEIAVIGSLAAHMRFQGAGSSHINPYQISAPLDALRAAAGSGILYAEGYTDHGETTDELIHEAVRAAEKAERVIIFAGLPDRYESEGFDRSDMKLPEGHLRLIDAVAEVSRNTAVVLFSGCAVECPFADRVKAILYMGLPGQAGGEAAAELLYGKVNPSGKLAETWPLCYEDVPSSEIYGKTKDALYEEGIYAGYRYYDKAGIPVRWPFGYGLSYTEFACSDLRIEGRTVTVAVTNTGERAGSEILQLYVEAPQTGIHRPVRELKDFRRIMLQPGESRTVTFELDDRAFAVWQEGWKIPSGRYMICIKDLCGSMDIRGDELTAPAWQKGSWYETCQGKPSRREWEEMLDHSYAEPVLKKGSYTMDNSVEEMKDHSLIMKIMYKAVESTVAKGFGGKKDYENPEFRMLMASSAGSPIRSMQISGGIKDGIMQGMLDMANGHFFRGLLKMITGSGR